MFENKSRCTKERRRKKRSVAWSTLVSAANQVAYKGTLRGSRASRDTPRQHRGSVLVRKLNSAIPIYFSPTARQLCWGLDLLPQGKSGSPPQAPNSATTTHQTPKQQRKSAWKPPFSSDAYSFCKRRYLQVSPTSFCWEAEVKVPHTFCVQLPWDANVASGWLTTGQSISIIETG